jgi:hypothetical protein
MSLVSRIIIHSSVCDKIIILHPKLNEYGGVDNPYVIAETELKFNNNSVHFYLTHSSNNLCFYVGNKIAVVKHKFNEYKSEYEFEIFKDENKFEIFKNEYERFYLKEKEY